MSLDRLELHEALSPLDTYDRGSIHVWGQENELLKLGSMFINSLEIVEVPLKTETFTNIISKFKTSHGKQSDCCQIPADNICFQDENVLKESLRHSTDTAIRGKFGIGEEYSRIEIDVSLKGLVICEPSESCKLMISQETHQGTVGTLFLQLPFDSDPCVAANVKTLLWGKTANHNYQKKLPFHQTFVTGNRNAIHCTVVTIEPVIKETPVAFLVFSLVWLDSPKLARVLKPGAFPDFYVKTCRASQALAGWMKTQKKTGDEKNLEKTKKHYDNVKIPPLKARKTNVLCIPLRHSYYLFDYRFDCLKKDDVLMANILSAIPDLDVNLVVIEVRKPAQPAESMAVDDVNSKKETGENPTKMEDETCEEEEDDVSMASVEHGDDNALRVADPAEANEPSATSDLQQQKDEDSSSDSGSSDDETNQMGGEHMEPSGPIIAWRKEATGGQRRTFSVHQWVHGDWIFPNVNKKFRNLRLNRHLVGDIESIIENESFGTEEPARKRARAESSSTFSYHPAIIIRPHDAAIADCWEHCPVRTLQCLTQRLTSPLDALISHGKESKRLSLLKEVNIVLDLVAKKGDKLNGCQRTAILHQLLYICTNLKAVDEGLKIMQLIPLRLCKCETDHKVKFDGFICEIRFFEIDNVIADFVIHAGWERCSSSVFTMFSRKRVRDYFCLNHLSSRLVENEWIEAGISSAKFCLEILVKKRDCVAEWELDKDHFHEYINLAESVDQKSRLEIYELLGKVAAKNAYAVYTMIDYFFDRLDDGGQQLEDLKSSITRILGQVDVCRAKDDSDIASVSAICFLHHTQNAELSEKLWSNLLSCMGGWNKDTPLFEYILSSQETWLYLDHCEILYKAIATSPVAKERFYKLIEDETAKFNESREVYFLESSFFHLTMAELEPDLADMEKLQSFCSAFRGMNSKLVTSAVKFIVRHNKDHHWLPPVSQTICTSLLECLPTNDLSTLISQESKDFCNVVGSFAKVGSRALKLKMIDILKKTFLNGNLEHSGAKTKVTPLLLNTWLTCLKTKLRDDESNYSVIVYQILNFLEFYLGTKKVRPHEAKAEHFSDLSQLLTFEFLDNFILALYAREHERAPKCLKDSLCHWNVSQILSDMFATHPKMKKEFQKFEPERIVKVARCFFWFGSKISNERFADLVCSIPFSSTRYCMSFSILSNSELKQRAMSSPFAFTALQKMVRHCIERIIFEIETHGSWHRPDVIVADHPEVEEFYHSNQRSKSFGPFQRMSEAKLFGESAIDGLQWAEFVISKAGSRSFCEITKLYPELLDANSAYSLPALCEILRSPYKELFSLAPSIEEIAKCRKCTICIRFLVRSARDT